MATAPQRPPDHRRHLRHRGLDVVEAVDPGRHRRGRRREGAQRAVQEPRRVRPAHGAPRNAVAESISTTDSKVYTIGVDSEEVRGSSSTVELRVCQPDRARASSHTSKDSTRSTRQCARVRTAGATAGAGDVGPAGDRRSHVRRHPQRAVLDVRDPARRGPVLPPLPASFYADPAAFAAHPIGNGPFEFVSYTPGSNILVHRYDGYAGPRPHTAGIEYRFYANLDDAYADVVAKHRLLIGPAVHLRTRAVAR